MNLFYFVIRTEVVQMEDNTMMDAINYVSNNKLHKEANTLANKVGDIYMACIMLYKNIPQTKENLEMCKRIVKQRREADEKAFYDFINGGWKNGINIK